MAIVNTVLGPLDTSKLGFTLSHEHVIVSSAGIQQTYPEFIDRAGTLKRAIVEFKQMCAEGVQTVVDVTTPDLGRDIPMLQEVSRASGINIISCTGTWLDIPRVFWAASPDDIARLYVREIEKGVDGTAVKAGIIKVAHDMGGVSAAGEIVLRAAARASNATGLPISTHTYAPERTGEQQLRILQAEGVALNRVYVGHSNDTMDLDYLAGLLKKGVWLGLDRLPGGNMPGTPDREGRAQTVKRLVDAGWAHRLMLGHDWSVTLSIATKERQVERRQRNPDGYLFITRRFIPRLKELGVPQSAIDQMMIDNPRRFFEGRA